MSARQQPVEIVLLSSIPPEDVLAGGYSGDLGVVAAVEHFRILGSDGDGRLSENAAKRDLYEALIYVTQGDEQRALEIVRQRRGAIAASLNYLARAAGAQHECWPAGAPTRKTMVSCWPSGSSEPKPLTDIAALRRRLCDETGPRDVLVSIDVNPIHAKRVLGAMREGTDYALKDTDLVALFSYKDEQSLVDVYDVARRMLWLINGVPERCRLVGINLSLDFFLVVRGVGESSPEVEDASGVGVSIPFLEDVRSILIAQHLAKRNAPTEAGPAIFAAAGNRLKKEEQVTRLAYPAIRPEVIAGTLIAREQESNGWEFPSSVDKPATWLLKPCFAVRPEKLDVDHPQTSDASAYLLGCYARMTANSNDRTEAECAGAFGRLAWLSRRAKEATVSTVENGLPSWVMVTELPPEAEHTALGQVQGVLEEAATEAGVDLAVYGSTAYVASYLALHGKRFEHVDQRALRDLGDLDLVAMESGQVWATAKTVLRPKINKIFGRRYSERGPRNIDVKTVDQLTTAGHRLSGQVPVAGIVQTRGGVLDVMQGVTDLKHRKIRLYHVGHPDAWRANALFAKGGTCPAVIVLRWISTIALLRVIGKAIGIEVRELPCAEENSMDLALRISRRAVSGSELLFGGCLFDERERIDRAMDRARGLLASCCYWGVRAKELERVLAQIERERRAMSYPQSKHPFQELRQE